MNKLTLVIMIVLATFLLGATAPPKKPAQTGTYKVGKYSKSSAKGAGGICFIDASQY